MRLPPVLRGLYPKLTSNTLHQWRCDELADANDLEDIIYNGENLVEQSGTDATLANGPVGRLREFNGTPYYHGATTGSDAGSLQNGDFWVEFLIRPNTDGSGYTGNGCNIVAYEGASSTAQFFVGLTTTNAIRVGSLGNAVITTAVVPKGQHTLVRIRAVDNGSSYTYEVYFNGTYVTDSGAISAPTGGGTCVWKIAESNSNPSIFDGDISFVHVEAAGMTSTDARESRRRITLQGFDKFVDSKVEILTSGWVDLTDLEGENWLQSVTVDDDVDALTKDFQVQCVKSIDRLSLSFLRTDSKVNNTDPLDPSQYDPIVRAGRDIRIHFAMVPLFLEPVSTDWHQYLEGEIDIVTPVGGTVQISGRDNGARLSQEWVEEETWYNNTRTPATASTSTAEAVIQQIVTDWDSTTPTLYTPVASGAVIRDWMQKSEPVHKAINAVAAVRAWDVRYRWNPINDAVQLVFGGPDRDKVWVDWCLDEQDYYEISDVKSDRSSVRNDMDVGYYDYGDLDSDGNPKKKFITVSDASSIAKYKKSWMLALAEPSKGLDSSTEATTWGGYMIDDLAEPDLDMGISTDFQYGIELHDRVSCAPDYDHFDTTQVIAPTSLSLKWTREGTVLSFMGRGKAVGGRWRWINMFTRPGQKPPRVQPPEFPLSSDFTYESIPGGLRVDWPKPNDTYREDWTAIEVHVSKTGSGFTPSSSTLVAKKKEGPVEVATLEPGETYYIKVIIVGEDNVHSSAIYLGSQDVKHIAGAYFDPLGRPSGTGLLLGGDFNSITRGDGDATVYAPDFWNPKSGATWNTDTLVSTSKARTGRHALQLQAPSGATGAGVDSKLIPVTPSTYYKWLQDWEADDNTSTAKMRTRILWYQDAALTASATPSTTVFDKAVDTANTPQQDSDFIQSPSDAQYALIEIDLDNATLGSTWNAYVDNVDLKPAKISFHAYKNGGVAQTPAASTWTAATMTTEAWDRGSVYDGTNTFTAPKAGTYTFHAVTEVTGDSGLSWYAQPSFNCSTFGRWIGARQNAPSGITTVGISVSATIELVAGETVTFDVYHTDTVTSGGASLTSLLYFSGIEDE